MSIKFNEAVHRIDAVCNEGFLDLTGTRGWNGWRTDDSTHFTVMGNGNEDLETQEETDVGVERWRTHWRRHRT